MPAGEGQRPGADHGPDALCHELGMPAFQLLRRVARERAERKLEVFVDVERARLVLLEEHVVLGFVLLAVEHAPVDEELAPLVVAVAHEQGVVEVEQDQAAARAFCHLHPSAASASRTSGSVNGRCRESEYSSRWARIATSVGKSRRTWVSR